MSLSDLKRITFLLITIILFCCACFAFSDTSVVKNFSVYFILIAATGLAISTFLCQETPTSQYALKCTTCNDNINKELFRLYELFESNISEDLHVVKYELIQIKDIISNASILFNNSFHGITLDIEQQKLLVNSLETSELDPANKNRIAQINLHNQFIRDNSLQCVRALQFEDLATQIVNNSSSRINEIRHYLAEFKSVIRHQRDNPSLYIDAINQLKVLIGNIKEFQLSRGYINRTEFVQKDLAAGRLELF